MSGFPTHPDHVTPDWLSAAASPASAITDTRWEPIGTGQVGDSVRFHCTHADGSASTLAAKFPAADAKSRATAAMLGLYAKEVRFYADIAPHLGVRVPQTFAAEVSEDGGEFVLLFEDLGPARGGNQLDSCSIEDARAAIRQAAAFHAPSWHNEAVIGAEWLRTPPAVTAQIRALYPQAQAEFAKRYSDVLEPEFMALCEQIAAMPELFSSREKPPQCLTHGDFRLDNMLFDIRGGAEPIAVLDWQTVSAGNAMHDIGYFLGTGIGDALRRAHEDELLDLYCDEMSARGVPLTRADIWDDYRRGALHGVTTAVFSAAFVERTERGDANFLSMARGGCALALEHDSIGALKEAG
ncbi:phosphotransferase [uncultured Erythrobacter sp.]|uniref:phosphotransferase family protein n=1 Tax=uncultured Erythrobacter sp. TaxID=263913 RepID=UPI002602287E|nr:phosphotransferase [uncultured Erythrobacter sp.]